MALLRESASGAETARRGGSLVSIDAKPIIDECQRPGRNDTSPDSNKDNNVDWDWLAR